MKSYNKIKNKVNQYCFPVNYLILEIPPFMLLIFKRKKVLQFLNICEQKEQMFIRCILYIRQQRSIFLCIMPDFTLDFKWWPKPQNCVSYKSKQNVPKTQKFINIIIKCRLINKQHWHTLGWIYCILWISC